MEIEKPKQIFGKIGFQMENQQRLASKSDSYVMNNHRERTSLKQV